jgi:putative GTP pyrophosphokinase
LDTSRVVSLLHPLIPLKVWSLHFSRGDSALGVPRDIRRQFSRLAGLLEIADAEFSSIREALAAYEATLPELIVSGPAAVSLDKVSLKAFIESSRPTQELARQLAELLGADLVKLDDPYLDGLLESELAPLRLLGIETVGHLETSLAENQERIRVYAARWLDGHRHPGEVLPKVDPSLPLLYLGYVLLGRSANKDLTREYLRLSQIQELGGEDTPQRILDVYRLAFPDE